MNVPQPMFITARLEAGVRLADGSVVSVYHIAGNQYGYRIENAEGVTLENQGGLRCPMAADYGAVMETLLSFLGAAAESYAYRGESENSTLFSPAVMEWAYGNADELTMLGMDLLGEENL